MGYDIHSYADCLEAFKSVRNPVLGKPLHGKGTRLYQNRDLSFRITMHERTFAYITKDDVITFVLDNETMVSTVCSSLVYTMNRFLPLGLYRVGSGRYRIGNLKGYDRLKELPEYFGGIRFNLETGECINPKPDRRHRVNPEARRVWLKALREFRMGVLSRLKLGVRGERGGETGFEAKEFAMWMRDKQYPDALFNYLATFSAPNYESQVATFVKLINDWRDQLRKEFGVFADGE